MFASRIFNLIFFHVVIWFGCNNLSTCNIVVACTVYVYVGISLEVWILLFAMVFTNLYFFCCCSYGHFVFCCFFFLRRSVWPFMKSAKSRWTLPPFFFVRPAFWVWGSCQILVLVSGRTSRRARTTGYGAGCVYMLWPTLLVNTLKRGRWTKGWGGFARCHLL